MGNEAKGPGNFRDAILWPLFRVAILWPPAIALLVRGALALLSVGEIQEKPVA